MSKQQAASKSDEIVVFEIVRDSACEECGEELGRGEFLRLERDKPLCLSCADLAHHLAVRAHVRHAHTGYDGLLDAGWDRHEARAEVAHEIERVVAKWSARQI